MPKHHLRLSHNPPWLVSLVQSDSVQGAAAGNQDRGPVKAGVEPAAVAVAEATPSLCSHPLPSARILAPGQVRALCGKYPVHRPTAHGNGRVSLLLPRYSLGHGYCGG